MKGNLLKKIGAVATTVAMIASVSVTGFAADVVYNTEAEGAQDITGKPIMATETTTAGIYKVEIPYKSTVANTIGVTMLSYANAEHAGFENANTPYANTMQIVGVDQINAGDTTNTIGVNGTGTFTFYVDTNGTDAEGTIRMNKGERGIVLLSGDAAASTTGYLFQVGKAAATVTVELGGSPVTEILEEKGWTGAGADYIKDIITTGSYKVKLGDAVADAAKVTVEAKGAEYDDTNWQAQTVVYTVSFNDDSYDITPAEITVKYAADTWNATGVEVEGVTVAKDDIQNGDLAAAVKAAINNVTLKAEEGSAVVAVEDDQIEVTVGTYTESSEESTYTASVKVLEDQYDRFIVGKDGVTDNDVTITVSVTKWDIASIALVEGTEATIAAGEVAYESAPANEEAILTAVKTAYENKVVAKSVDGKSGAVAADKVTVTKKDGSYNKETKTAQTLTYTIGIADGTAVSGSNAIADASELKIDVTYTITVTGHPAPAFIYGDVDGNGTVNARDCSELFKYVSSKTWDARVNEPEYAFDRANVDLNTAVNARDASHIFKHIADKTGYTLPIE